jgi:hypothetical protein
VTKRIDHFLVFASLMSDHNRIRTWVKVRGESNHLLIFLQITREECKPPTPFKFNSSSLENEDFVRLVRANGCHLMPPSKCLQAYNVL